MKHTPIRAIATSMAVTLAGVLVGCGGGGGSSSSPAVPVAGPSGPSSGNGGNPVSLQSTQMNQLTSYTVYAGSADGTDLTTELSPLSTASAPSGSGSYVAVAPQDLLTSGTPLAPTPVPGAYVAWPDGSVTVTDVLGNFDASSAPYVQNNQSVLATATGNVEVVVDPSQSAVAPQAPALDTYVDAYEPSGSIVTASSARALRDSSTPAPALAGLAVLPAVHGMYDGEQRIFTAVGKDTNGRRIDIGRRYPLVWSVSDCNGGTARGSLVVPGRDASKVIYRAPKTGTSGTTCPDIVTAMYTPSSPSPSPSTSPSPTSSSSPSASPSASPSTSPSSTPSTSPSTSPSSAPIKASAKAYFAAKSEKVVYAGTLLDKNGNPVAHGLVDFTSASAATFGKTVAWTDAYGHFAAKVPQGRTIQFVAANRTVNAKVITYTWWAVNLTSGSVSAGTGASGLVLQETTQLNARP